MRYYCFRDKNAQSKDLFNCDIGFYLPLPISRCHGLYLEIAVMPGRHYAHNDSRRGPNSYCWIVFYFFNLATSVVTKHLTIAILYYSELHVCDKIVCQIYSCYHSIRVDGSPKVGVSKLQPAGQNRPASPFHPARRDVLQMLLTERIYSVKESRFYNCAQTNLLQPC